MANEYDIETVRIYYPLGSHFLTLMGDRVRVVNYHQKVRCGTWMLVVQYPTQLVKIYPFNGHRRENGEPIEPASPQDVCENDTMQL